MVFDNYWRKGIINCKRIQFHVLFYSQHAVKSKMIYLSDRGIRFSMDTYILSGVSKWKKIHESYLIGEEALANSYHRMLPAIKMRFKASNLNICTRINNIIGLLLLQVEIGKIGSRKPYTSRFW